MDTMQAVRRVTMGDFNLFWKFPNIRSFGLLREKLERKKNATAVGQALVTPGFVGAFTKVVDKIETDYGSSGVAPNDSKLRALMIIATYFFRSKQDCRCSSEIETLMTRLIWFCLSEASDDSDSDGAVVYTYSGKTRNLAIQLASRYIDPGRNGIVDMIFSNIRSFQFIEFQQNPFE